MNLEFLGRIRELGLGFARRENGRREEEKKEKMSHKMKGNGCKTLLYMRLGRVDPNPTHSLLFLAV